jgi:hypothetical protein
LVARSVILVGAVPKTQDLQPALYQWVSLLVVGQHANGSTLGSAPSGPAVDDERDVRLSAPAQFLPRWAFAIWTPAPWWRPARQSYASCASPSWSAIARASPPGRPVTIVLHGSGRELRGAIETISPEVDAASGMVLAQAKVDPSSAGAAAPQAGEVVRVMPRSAPAPAGG